MGKSENASETVWRYHQAKLKRKFRTFVNKMDPIKELLKVTPDWANPKSGRTNSYKAAMIEAVKNISPGRQDLGETKAFGLESSLTVWRNLQSRR